MRNSIIQEILVSSALIALLVFFLNPFSFWMPNNVLMLMVIVLVIVFSLFASFIWKESARDEREALHRMLAGRIAFLSGSGVLVVGIIVQSFSQSVDFWLVITLATMIFAKILGLIYSRVRH